MNLQLSLGIIRQKYLVTLHAFVQCVRILHLETYAMPFYTTFFSIIIYGSSCDSKKGRVVNCLLYDRYNNTRFFFLACTRIRERLLPLPRGVNAKDRKGNHCLQERENIGIIQMRYSIQHKHKIHLNNKAYSITHYIVLSIYPSSTCFRIFVRSFQENVTEVTQIVLCTLTSSP